MSSAPTYADAELILKLYEARREAEIRKARSWWTQTFWPESADDILGGNAHFWIAREQMVPAGRRVLGNGRFLREERRVE